MSDSVRPPRQQPTRLPIPGILQARTHFLLQCMKVKSESEVAQSCLTLRDPMDCSLLGSSIHGIFHARVLEWGAIAFSIQWPRWELKKKKRLSWAVAVWTDSNEIESIGLGNNCIWTQKELGWGDQQLPIWWTLFSHGLSVQETETHNLS